MCRQSADVNRMLDGCLNACKDLEILSRFPSGVNRTFFASANFSLDGGPAW